jgi:uroporphyrinogen decarboxylase
MRQAGRYLPEYREVREQHPFLEMIRTPELAVQVTLQPLQRFPLDAAIIFADLLPPLIGMGVDLTYTAGEGPSIGNPVRNPADVERLRVPSPEENVPFTLEAIRLARRELGGRVPLIGFAGAPFTLASYLVEGGSSRDQARAKAMMAGEPRAWHLLMDKLVQLVGAYLIAQVQAGAQALQIFDSWVGSLSPADYREHVLPYSRCLIEIARATTVPVIHFGTGTGGMLELLAAAGGDVIGLDWRVDLDVAWGRLGNGVAVQGNLDPAVLQAPRDVMLNRTREILERAGGRAGHIFNLGHGILPNTPIENVSALVELVHNWSPARASLS